MTDWHLAPVLDTGDFVLSRESRGAHPDLSVSGDPETQFRDTFRFLAATLQRPIWNFDDIVEMTTCHVGLRTIFPPS